MNRLPFAKLKFWLQVSLGMGLATGFAIALHHSPVHGLLQNTLRWIQDLGAIGVFAFILLYNLATLLLIPGSLLTVGGGMLYGVVWGSMYVTVASVLGAIAAFLLGRSVARSWVKQQIQNRPTFQRFDCAVAQEGYKFVFLIRLCPVVPFNFVNYVLGATCISLRDYVLGSVGMIPGTVMYVYIGSLIGDIAMLDMQPPVSPQVQIIRWCVKGLGLLATIALTIYLSRIARRTLSPCVTSTETRHDDLH